MKTSSEIIEKIRSLLRLAKSSNPHEAASAMAKALELATKHQIDLNAISPEDDLNRILGEEVTLPSRLASEYKEALNTVHAYFNVHVTVLIGVSSRKALIVGTQLDIELASYLVTFLVRSCRACLATWKESERKARRKTTGAKVQSYIRGYFLGVRSKLRMQRANETASHEGLALILSTGEAQREAATQGFVGGLKSQGDLALTQARLDRRSSFQGFAAGQDTEINPGLKGQPVLALN